MGVLTGSPPKTSLTGYTPWIKDPGYDFGSIFYDYLKGMIGKPMPGYSGPTAKSFGFKSGMNTAPMMKNLFGMASRYMDTGMPTVFGQATGSLGRFLAPSFQNPLARLQLGAPNYFDDKATPPLFGPDGGA